MAMANREDGIWDSNTSFDAGGPFGVANNDDGDGDGYGDRMLYNSSRYQGSNLATFGARASLFPAILLYVCLHVPSP